MNNEIYPQKRCNGYGVHCDGCEACKPAPVAAGTMESVPSSIDTPSIERWTFQAWKKPHADVVRDPAGELVKYDDHLQHVAAAVAEAEKRAWDRGAKSVWELQRKASAATAPVVFVPSTVSAVPGADEAKLLRDAWSEYTGKPVPRDLSDAMCDFAAGWKAGRASLPPSAGAPVSETFNAMVKAASDIDGNCAPVSGAEQAPSLLDELRAVKVPAQGIPAWKNHEAGGAEQAGAKAAAQNEANSPQTRMDAWFGSLFEAGVTPAGGQELPAHDAKIIALAGEELAGVKDAELLKFARALLAMRQPQGDDSETVSISLDAAEHALAAMKEKYFAGGYNNLYADDRSFVVHSMNELKDGIAAKQAGKEGA